MRTRLSADWVVGHDAGRHCLIERGEIVYQDDRIIFVGHDFPGEVDVSHACGKALIAPGFIDLDALADLDTTILGFDNQPGWRKGRVWPQSYMDRGPVEMYSAEELAFQKRYAFAQLLRNGITTALPIASLFYREWGETAEEFAAAADIAGELGLRVYLGPAYRSGNQVVDASGTIGAYFDEARGLSGLETAIAFCRAHEGRHGGLVRTMLAPDRIETCTPELLRRTAAAALELDVPVRLHCCQSRIEYEMVWRGMVSVHPNGSPAWGSCRRVFCCRTSPGSPVRAVSIGRVMTWRSSPTPVRRSCTAHWFRHAAVAHWTASPATDDAGCGSAWVPTPGRRTWFSTCSLVCCCAG